VKLQLHLLVFSDLEMLYGKVFKKIATLRKVKFCTMGNKNNVFVLQFSSVFCLMLGILTIELLSVRSPKNTMKR
jgi:hypothetical protein